MKKNKQLFLQIYIDIENKNFFFLNCNIYKKNQFEKGGMKKSITFFTDRALSDSFMMEYMITFGRIIIIYINLCVYAVV